MSPLHAHPPPARVRAVSGLLSGALLGLVLGASPSAAAVSQRGTVPLHGTVATSCYLVVTDHGSAIDMENGAFFQAVGSVGESCNKGQGYTVTIASENNGRMVNETGQGVGYAISYGDLLLDTLRAPVELTRRYAQPELRTRQFRVLVPVAFRSLTAGTYSDTITLTIAAR